MNGVNGLEGPSDLCNRFCANVNGNKNGVLTYVYVRLNSTSNMPT